MEYSTEEDRVFSKGYLSDIYYKTYTIEWVVSVQEGATPTGED